MTRRPDILDTFRGRRFGSMSFTLHGTLAAQYYLGDGSGGVTMPDGSLEGLHFHAGTADDGNTEVTLHNVTQGTSQAVTLTANAEDSVDVSLDFDEGDEFALEVTSVTTPGSDLSVLFEVEQDMQPADH